MKMLLITDSPDAIIGMRLAGVDTVRVKNPEAALTCKKNAQRTLKGGFQE